MSDTHMKALVKKVRKAVKSTDGRMILDLVVYDEQEPEIQNKLQESLEYYDEDNAVAEAIEWLFSRHEDTMKDICQEDARHNSRLAKEFAKTL